MIKDESIERFLERLASREATPGGGSAAAVSGGMGAALVSMVCNLTIGKKAYQAFDAELTTVLAEADLLRTRFIDMVQADVEAFDRVMRAYRLPKASDAEQTARSREIQSALKAAADVPLDCARAAADVIRLARIVAEKGNRSVISDAGVAVLAGYTALKSAALNVDINLGGIRDEDFVQSRRAALFALIDGCGYATEEIYCSVQARL